VHDDAVLKKYESDGEEGLLNLAKLMFVISERAQESADHSTAIIR
jgi:hypothetical protein